MKLTTADIRNPDRKSGYDHVNVMRHPHQVTYRGQAYAKAHPGLPVISRSNHVWYGPSRATPEEAAQDYCDWINSGGLVTPATLTTHGHTRKKRRKIERNQRELDALRVLREEAAKRKVEQANYVYLVGMEGNPKYVKIGEAFDPEDRYIGGQTFNPYTLVLLGYFRTDIARDADKVLHQELAAHQHKGEWFRPTREVLSRFGITNDEFLRRCGGTTEEVKTAA